MPGPIHIRNSLVAVTLEALPNSVDLRNFVAGIRPGAWASAVPASGTHEMAVTAIVDAADGPGWLRELVAALAKRFSGRPEFSQLLATIDAGEAGTAFISPGEPAVVAVTTERVND